MTAGSPVTTAGDVAGADVFSGLTPPYRTIVAGRPWHYDKVNPDKDAEGYHGGGLPYSSMTLDEIRALPVGDLTDAGRCFLWTTNRYIRQWHDTTWFQWPLTSTHSRKPDAFLDLVESWCPGPYVELVLPGAPIWVGLLGQGLREHRPKER